MTWRTLRGEFFGRARAPNKRQNEEKKINFTFYLVEPRKKTEEKRNDDELEDNEIKRSLSLLFLAKRLDFCLQRNKREDRLKS